ncbi:hypothetical protein RCO48_32840 [Peribacillus frigoritolerans]|nr:hypothetical protein [Peribacillus frigoritolerans]
MKKIWKKPILPIASISLATVMFVNAIPETPVQAKLNVESQVQMKNHLLPLGTPNLQEKRTSMNLAPGVKYTKINRGETSSKDFYTVDVAFVETQKQAKKLLEKFKERRFPKCSYHKRIGIGPWMTGKREHLGTLFASVNISWKRMQPL